MSVHAFVRPQAGRSPIPRSNQPRPFTVVTEPDPVVQLTRREREVLALIAEGHGNAAICGQLWIGAKTLERHVQNIFTKLDLPPDSDRHRRVCAVLLWLRSPVSRATLESLR